VLDYSTTETADFGVLKAFASATLSVPGPGTTTSSITQIDVEGTAGYRDQWTIVGTPAESGAVGTVILTFTLTGNFTSSSPGSLASAFLITGLCPGGVCSFGGGASADAFGPGAYQVTVPFIFGETLDYEFLLEADATLFGLANGGTNGDSATVDLSETAQLTGITVMDGGTAVPFTLTTASDSPNYDAALAPEPASMWLLAAGLLGFGVIRSQRSKCR